MTCRTFWIVSILFVFPLLTHAWIPATESLWPSTGPKREVRAVWLATIGGIDWPRTKATDSRSIRRQKDELIRMLDKLRQANINTVLLQTRIRGTVIYPSAMEPWDNCLTGRYGQSPGYDPLAFAIEECHKRGMELHAWVVCIPLGTAKKQKAYGMQSVTRRQPRLCKTVRGEVFMQPAESGTADYIASLCREIATHYDVDGISLDYIRYPEAVWHYTDACNARERRDNISRIVRRVHDAVKEVGPWIKLSSSPIGKYRDVKRYSSRGWNCYDVVYQDPQLWLRENWQDMLFPMMYFQGDHFYPFLFDWAEHDYGHPVVPGLGIYFLDPREGRWRLSDVRAQIHATRTAGIGGQCYYRSEYLVRSCQGLFDAVCQEFNPYPALPPRMTWTGDTLPPAAPARLRLDEGTLYWDAPQRTADDNSRDYLTYNIYGSDSRPVDTDCPENLLATGIRSTQWAIAGQGCNRRFLAVRAQDRYGNESPAVQVEQPQLRSFPRLFW